MSFVELFGSIERITVLDFLADHVNYAYTLEEIQEEWGSLLHNISPLRAVDELVEHGLIKIVNTKYQLNTDNQIIRAVLKQDFEEAKKEADRLSLEGK